MLSADIGPGAFQAAPENFFQERISMIDQRLQFLTTSDEFQILATTVTADSGWVDVSQYKLWSVFVSGLETGAAVTVELMNKTTAPLAGDKGASISLPAVDANGNSYFETSAKPYHWLRLKKVQGGSPTASVGVLFGAR
jgi:hypothetical protein